MSATIHILTGPAGARLTEQMLAAYYDSRHELGSTVILTPSSRIAQRLRSRLGTCLSPSLMGLQQFADEVVYHDDSSMRPLSDIDRQILLDSILQESPDGSDLSYFAGVAETRGYAAAALGYITELKQAGVERRQLIKASPSSGDQAVSKRHYQAKHLFLRYHDRLKKLNRLDPSDRLGRAAALWNKGVRHPFSRLRSLFLIGFNSFQHFERRLIDAIRDTIDHVWVELTEVCGEASAIPQATQKWLTSPVGERHLWSSPPALVRQNIERDGPCASQQERLASLFEPVETPSSPPLESARVEPAQDGSHHTIHLIEAAGQLGEARLVARRIRTLLGQGLAAERIVVVTRRLVRTTCELYREVFQ